MAKSDYALCEVCDGKVFYDADTEVGDAAIFHRDCLTRHDAAVAAKAWAEGYDEGVQRGIGLERTGHLTTRRNELDPIPTNPYEREEASHE